MTLLVRLGVAVETPLHSAVAGLLDYECERALSPGSLVRVPLGRRVVPGIVWRPGSGETPSAELRRVDAVLEPLPPLDDAWRALVAFAAGYYQRGLGELALSVLPPELRRLDAVQLSRRLKRLDRESPVADVATVEPPELTPEQRQVLAAIETADRPALLHGVTGSGKTEV